MALNGTKRDQEAPALYCDDTITANRVDIHETMRYAHVLTLTRKRDKVYSSVTTFRPTR